MGVESAMDFMVVFDIFVGGYLLYYAIMGKGKLYEGDYPKEMMEPHRQLLRKFCWIVGIPMLVLSILEYTYGYQSIWATISIVYALSAVVIYLVIFVKRFGKYLYPQKAAQKQGKGKGRKRAKKK